MAFHDRTDRGVLRLKQWNFVAYVYFLDLGFDLELTVHADDLIHIHVDIVEGERFKAGLADGDLIFPGLEDYNVIVARAGTDGGARNARRPVAGRHGRPDDHRAARV